MSAPRKPSGDARGPSQGNSQLQQQLAGFNCLGIVHRQDFNRHSSNRRESGQPRAVPFKVPTPIVRARMKQADHCSTLFFPSGKIGAFETVAIKTTPRQVFGMRITTMLDGNDVVDLKRSIRHRFGQVTILATERGATANKLTKRFVHRSRPRLKGQPSLELENIDRP